MKLAYLLPAILLLASTAHAESLNSLVNKQANKTVHAINQEEIEYNGEDAYTYALSQKDVIYADINKDGKKDAIVSLYYCEELNCHNTTGSFEVATFLATGKNQYKKGDVYLVGLTGNVKVVNGIIHVTEVSYADSDPSCCPSKKRTVKLKSNNQGKLVKVK